MAHMWVVRPIESYSNKDVGRNDSRTLDPLVNRTATRNEQCMTRQRDKENDSDMNRDKVKDEKQQLPKTYINNET